jgi:pantoate--beta-alanine ligase
MRIAQDRAELTEARRNASGRVAVVMTMGALHEGHAALLREARKNADTLIATIFVNPLQFGPNEDFTRYPRTLAADLEVCEREGVDIVFTPDADVMYPGGQPGVTVDPGVLGTVLEGAVRPGHFAGVLTVVHKLLCLTGADVAYFGEKDYLDLAVEIIGVPTVRESDGLALSSRNRYLDDDQRLLALHLSRALRAGQAAAAEGADAVAAAAAALAPVEADYLELRATDLGPAPAAGEARLLVAARVGSTRLIDNAPVQLRSKV